MGAGEGGVGAAGAGAGAEAAGVRTGGTVSRRGVGSLGDIGGKDLLVRRLEPDMWGSGSVGSVT